MFQNNYFCRIKTNSKQFKMAAYKKFFSGLKQRSVTKFLLSEKCKHIEIYTRMCNAYGEACFSQMIFTGFNLDSHHRTKSKKQFIMWKHTESPAKKKLRAQWSLKKLILTVPLDIKESITTDFFGKGSTVNSASNCQLFWKNSLYLLNDPCIILKLGKIEK